MNYSSRDPIILLRARHYADRSYIFTCKMNSDRTPPFRYFELKGHWERVFKKVMDKKKFNMDEVFLERVQHRVLDASYMDDKIVVFWGWGIEIYSLDDERETMQNFEGLPMDYFLPIVELFATVFCLFQALISTHH